MSAYESERRQRDEAIRAEAEATPLLFEVVEWWRDAAYTLQAERDEIAEQLAKAEQAMRDYTLRETVSRELPGVEMADDAVGWGTRG